jgi:hypothetical protein
MPTRAVVRQFDRGPICPAPDAKSWLIPSGGTTDHPLAFDLHEQNRPEPLVSLLLESANGIPRFSPDGSHPLWGNSSGAVTVVDLVEVNRRLTEIGLGW